MKKYDVYKLYVVSVEKDGSIHRFICKQAGFSDAFVEIFTGDKIKPRADHVEPLSKYYSEVIDVNYYSRFTNSNVTSSYHYWVTKKDLLNKYIEINRDVNLEKEEIQESEEDHPLIDAKGILEKATVNFFPKEGSWGGDCFRKPSDLSINYLPCHLRDNLWLAEMLKRDQRLFFMTTRKVLEFVSYSPFFRQKRHEYELEIVRWQIDWMRNGGENWTVDDEYGGDFVFLTSTADLGFRKGVVDTLTRIGMDPEVIEEGIEKYSNMWRDTFMRCSFRNEYEPIFMNFANFFDEDKEDMEKNKRAPLEPCSEEHKNAWLKMRKYEYYKNHKDSVDKYGVVEPEMTMSDEEVEELKLYLEQMDKERKTLIEDYKTRGTGRRKALES